MLGKYLLKDYSLASLFCFQTHLLGNKRSAPIVIKGSREWIEQYIPFQEFTEIFAGYLLWREPQKASKMMPGEALGVWGRRNVSKLRRILRERGANFEVLEEEGPSQQLAIRGESPRGA
jgi:hypothetical protein